MQNGTSQLSLDFGRPEGTPGSRPVRKARRVATVRLVELAPFPREHRDERWAVGFTLDLSSQGACLRTKESAPVGSLLRVIVRGVDGRPTLDTIARVTWEARGRFGEIRMGVEFVATRSRRPRRIGAREPAVAA
jgi:hypothetical protein